MFVRTLQHKVIVQVVTFTTKYSYRGKNNELIENIHFVYFYQSNSILNKFQLNLYCNLNHVQIIAPIKIVYDILYMYIYFD